VQGDMQLRRVPIALTTGWGGLAAPHFGLLASRGRARTSSGPSGRCPSFPNLHSWTATLRARCRHPRASWAGDRRHRSAKTEERRRSRGIACRRAARVSQRVRFERPVQADRAAARRRLVGSHAGACADHRSRSRGARISPRWRDGRRGRRHTGMGHSARARLAAFACSRRRGPVAHAREESAALAG
jgi:hypothetical protein